MNIILKGVKIYKNKYLEKLDILVSDNIIKKIEKNIDAVNGEEVINLNNRIICSGFIDSHTHCYPEENKFGVEPDKIGVQAGVPTIVDAGSSGINNFENFYNKYILTRDTDIFCFLNLAEDGIKYGKELSDLSKINLKGLEETISKYPDVIVGTKLRMSGSVVGDSGVKPIELNNQLLEKMNIKSMIHIGNKPPKIEEILNLIGEKYIVTHFLHGKENGIFKGKKIIPEFYQAKERGAIFDLGHGSSSFSQKSFNIAVENGIFPDSISSDVHTGNINGKVRNLIYILNKLVKNGADTEKLILGVTSKPAEILNLSDRGSIEEGKKGIFTILNEQEFENGVILVEEVFTKEKLIKVDTREQRFNNMMLEIQKRLQLSDTLLVECYEGIVEIERMIKEAEINFKYDFKLMFYTRIIDLILKLKNKIKVQYNEDMNFDKISKQASALAEDIMVFLSQKYEGEFDRVEAALMSIQIQLAIDMEEE